jgi:hypothetical protein
MMNDVPAMSSHLPLLEMLGRNMQIERVLELGCGLHSTGSFLDREVFPTVQHVCSLEHSLEWIDRVQKQFPDDDRLTLRHAPEPVWETLIGMDLADFDLIFVDNSTSWAEREVTIKHLASRSDITGLVLIHDIEFGPYREAARGFRSCQIYDSGLPSDSIDGTSQTGVCWQ